MKHTKKSIYKKMGSKNKHCVYYLVKRAFDFLFSLVAILLLILPSLIIALVIYLDDPHGSPIFKQKRVGFNKNEFTMFKFRTMYVNAEDIKKDIEHRNEKDGPVFKIKDDPRITRVGKWLRKTSIDEVPQFINVFIGDMSVVGPRPPLPEEVEQYTPEQMKRLEAKPGITCEWQIQPNRDDISFDKWVQMDCEYIQKKSVLNDLRIILRTVVAVLGGYGT